MKKFEIPYNFQSSWIDYYRNNEDLHEYIDFVYVGAVKEGNIKHARSCIKSFDYDWNEFDKHIKLLQNEKIKICILMQVGATLELIEKYIKDYNINIFCINDDELAKQLKEKYGNSIYLILSITRIITVDEILNNENLKYYDLINLHFWFNRKLHIIKKLPKKYMYSLLVSDYCYYNCKIAKQHWFCDDDKNIKCLSATKNTKFSTRIGNNDLKIFNKYIDYYKISGKECHASIIFDTLRGFVDGLNSKDKLSNNIEDEYSIIDKDDPKI